MKVYDLKTAEHDDWGHIIYFYCPVCKHEVDVCEYGNKYPKCGCGKEWCIDGDHARTLWDDI